jgi:hypothetical protein
MNNVSDGSKYDLFKAPQNCHSRLPDNPDFWQGNNESIYFWTTYGN